MKRQVVAALAASVGVFSAACAQAGGGGATPRARAQIEQVRRAAQALGTPEAARAAGYHPVFGQVPLQGEHYVRTDLVEGGRFDPSRPPVLMFAPVNGVPRLVGAAFAYLRPVAEGMPEGFDGDADHWHTHDDLVRVPGKRLAMTHVWLVDAPDGTFARYNPWLPFLAVGVTPPPAGSPSLRELARALALVTAPPPEVERVERSGGAALTARLRTHRASIRALLPRLRATDERATAEAIRHSDAMIDALRAAAGPQGNLRELDRALAEFLATEEGHHGH